MQKMSPISIFILRDREWKKHCFL
uniref:Uncharacterized protein n=1 Tax=Anguilla anguilla TaxID=7936 RepID=A0A0E9U9T5_ANGAN